MDTTKLLHLAQEHSITIENRLEQYEEDLWNDFYLENNLTEEEIEFLQNNF